MMTSPLFWVAALSLLVDPARAAGLQDPDPSLKALQRSDMVAWAKSVRLDAAEAQAKLVALGDDALIIIREFLATEDEYLIAVAARVCDLLGTAASELDVALISALQHSGNEWVQWECVRALGAVGKNDTTVAHILIARLFDEAGSSRMRQECARALWRIDPKFAEKILQFHSRGMLSRERALDALTECGVKECNVLINLLLTQHGEYALVEKAITSFGWRVAPSLIDAGLNELALQSFLDGVLRYVTRGEQLTLEWSEFFDKRCALGSVVNDVEISGIFGEGRLWTVVYCLPGENGDEIVWNSIKADLREVSEKWCVKRAVMSKSESLALMQQIALVDAMCLSKEPPWRSLDNNDQWGWRSSRFISGAVRIKVKEDIDKRCSFHGFASSRNLSDRWQTEVCLGLLQDVVRAPLSVTREIGKADIERIRLLADDERLSEESPLSDAVKEIANRFR